MPDYRRYQPRRSAGQPGRWRRWLSLIIIGLVVVLIGRGIFGRGKPAAVENQSADITLVNENANVDNNVNAATNANENATSDANTNTASQPAGTETFTDFSLDVCQTPISSFGQAKEVALTFDLAGANEAAQKVLNILDQKKARASFFATGTFAEKNKDFVATVAKAGFSVYSHSYESKNMTSLSADQLTSQIDKAETAITAATGESPKPLLRPPYGDYNAAVAKAARDAGYCLILWTVDAFDWQDGMTAAGAKQRVLDKAAPGAIILLHAGYDLTPEFLADLIDALRAKGLTLVSLPTLLQP